jgi:hypothetical protein
MDTPTAQALFEERVTRNSHPLAIEVVALRALIDALMENMQELKTHIIELAQESPEDECLTIRGAGGIAAVDMLDDWMLKAMGNLNDVASEAAAAEWD